MYKCEYLEVSDRMGLLSILKKLKQKEKEMRILMLGLGKHLLFDLLVQGNSARARGVFRGGG